MGDRLKPRLVFITEDSVFEYAFHCQ